MSCLLGSFGLVVVIVCDICDGLSLLRDSGFSWSLLCGAVFSLLHLDWCCLSKERGGSLVGAAVPSLLLGGAGGAEPSPPTFFDSKEK